ETTRQDTLESLVQYRAAHPSQTVSANPLFGLTRRFWSKLTASSLRRAEATYQDLSQKDLQLLSDSLTNYPLSIRGKGVFKEEFVTCGGVDLREIDMKSMRSKKRPGLFFAGEVLDIDGITGGFNFQSAWTTGFLAGTAIRSLKD